MKILITGGSGFIGTHLTRRLLSQNHEVCIFDLKPPKHPDHPRLAWIGGDLRRRNEIKAATQDQFDFIFHFAAIVSVPECEGDPDGSAKTNVEGTRNLVQCVLDCTHPRPPIGFASSAAVYGDACKGETRLKEDFSPLAPVSHYGRQKLESEHLIRELVQREGLRALSFRFFNVFGEGQDPTSPYSGVITRFREAIRGEREALLFNEGRSTRDFISVADIARGCSMALQLSHEHLNGQAVNLCSGRSISVFNLYNEMCSQVRATSRFKLMPPRSGDIEHSCGDPSQARSLFGFETSSERNWWE